VLSRQQQPHPRGDDRAQITRVRQAAEALFTSKPLTGQHASSPGTADADRPVNPQTAGAADTLAGGAGPSRGAWNVGRP
jgi:hypothetical protein